MSRRQLLNFVVFTLCLGLPVIGWWYFDQQISLWFPVVEQRGLYGDQFGALNALFSGLAAGGIVFTLFLSYQQLRLQHEEFEHTTKSLQSNQIALAEQTKLLSEQISDSVPRTHSVIAAEDRLEFAQLLLKKSRESLEEAINFLTPENKREQAHTALQKSDRVWQEHMEASVGFSLAAWTFPEGSTTTLAGITFIQARMTEERAQQLGRWDKRIQEERGEP